MLKNLITIWLFCFFTRAAFSQTGAIHIVQLQTEYTSVPMGIDVQVPRFSWQMSSASPGCYQTAYQLSVVSETGQTVWNSGKVLTGQSLNISYSGETLKARTRYNWTVTVWDQSRVAHTGQSSFETGLLNPGGDLSAWSGAKWIGGNDDDMVLYAPYVPVFKLSCTIQLDQTSAATRAGIIYGANDTRLMDKNKNYFGISSRRDSAYVLVELNIAPLASGSPAQVNIYRTGYNPGDKKDIPLKSFQIPQTLINSQNRYDGHRLFVSSVIGATEIYVDGEEKENLVGKIGINPLGQGGDYIAFPVLANIGVNVPNHQAAFFSGLQVRNFRSPSNRLFSTYTIPVKISADGTDVMKLQDPDRNSMPMLRTTFSAKNKTIRKARLYVTARGIYDVYMNGHRLGSDYFNPGLTQYNKTQLYQTFDVTRIISSGRNALGAILGEGWWSGGSTYMGEFWNFFGDRQSLLAKLVITYADGQEQTVVTDPSTWSYFNNGPIVYGSFFQGEVYDAGKEALVKDWSTAAYNDTGWHPATEVGLKDHISTDRRNPSFNMPMVDDYSKLNLTGQFGETVQKVKEITAVSVTEVRPGVFVYDLGRNIAGLPLVSLSGLPAGKVIKLRFAEVKYPDLPEYKDNVGMIMLENIRAAMSQEIYVTRGGQETISPRFTYHGFRYMEITGIDKALPLSAVKGQVLSSVHQFSADYETSDSSVNRLWQNINWSTLANFMSVPTDCPQRNERLGWSGDISVFSRTATYLAEIPQFLRRHMLAMRDVQREDGRFTDVAPLGGGFGDTLWGSAGITVAWESYQQYGDIALLTEHYDAMKRYIEFLTTRIDAQTNVLDEKNRTRWASLGDWLSPEYDKTEKTLLWEAYFIYDLAKMGKIAALLGKPEDAVRFNRLLEQRKAFFNTTYLNTETAQTMFRGKAVDTQTSYAVPLAFGLFDDKWKDRITRNFAATISRQNISDQGKPMPPYSLMTGFIGTAWVSTALSMAGRTDLAYRQLEAKSYPSWLYPVEQGATTIWERLNSYTHTEGFGGNNNMNSFNHYSFGAVGAWMQNHSLGIQRDEKSPGFSHFLLAPEPDPTGQLTYAKGYYDSMYGRIESSWIVKGQTRLYHFRIPANTSATLYLDAASVNDIKQGEALLASARNTKYLGIRDKKFVFELQSGDYDLVVKGPKAEQQ